ncbi:LOW QUALITY PROTEIN: hypothetical protein OPAG_06091, partial [Rhodococcus opacus PD630]
MVDDPALLHSIRRVAAAADRALNEVDVADARHVWGSAPIVVLDARAAAACRNRLPRRRRVVLLCDGPPGIDEWRIATAVGAEHVLAVPEDESALVAVLGEQPQRPEADGTVVAVVGGCGGAGGLHTVGGDSPHRGVATAAHASARHRLVGVRPRRAAGHRGRARTAMVGSVDRGRPDLLGCAPGRPPRPRRPAAGARLQQDRARRRTDSGRGPCGHRCRPPCGRSGRVRRVPVPRPGHGNRPRTRRSGGPRRARDRPGLHRRGKGVAVDHREEPQPGTRGPRPGTRWAPRRRRGGGSRPAADRVDARRARAHRNARTRRTQAGPALPAGLRGRGGPRHGRQQTAVAGVGGM